MLRPVAKKVRASKVTSAEAETPRVTQTPPRWSAASAVPSVRPPTDSTMRSYLGEGGISSPTVTSWAPSWRSAGDLIGAAGARRHVGAAQARELHREVADAAGGAGDQHAAAEQRAVLAERVERGEAGHREGGGLRERHLLGQLGERVRGHGHALGPGAFRQEPDHARADLGAGAVGGGALHVAGQVPAGAPARGGHGGAADLAAVERDRADADDGFAAVGDRVGDGADDEAAGGCGVDDYGVVVAHRVLLMGPLTLPSPRRGEGDGAR